MIIASIPIVVGDIEYNVREGDYNKGDVILNEGTKKLSVSVTGKMLFDIGCRLIWTFSVKDMMTSNKLLLKGVVQHELIHRKDSPLTVEGLNNAILESFTVCSDKFHKEIQDQFGINYKVTSLRESDSLNYAQKLLELLIPLQGQ